jgi:hypothetical protein
MKYPILGIISFMVVTSVLSGCDPYPGFQSQRVDSSGANISEQANIQSRDWVSIRNDVEMVCNRFGVAYYGVNTVFGTPYTISYVPVLYWDESLKQVRYLSCKEYDEKYFDKK